MSDVKEVPEEGVSTLVLHHILLKRDPMMILPVDVFAHELPVMRAIHGDDNIEEKTSEEVDVEGFDVELEYDRLYRKYEKDPDNLQAFINIYGSTPRVLAEEINIEYKVSGGARKQRVVKHNKEVDNSGGKKKKVKFEN